jgi:hypothetical protein
MEETTERTTPEGSMILLDMGRQRRKQVSRLRKGQRSRLLEDVTASIQELRDAGTISPTAETVVVVVRERRRRRKLAAGLL